MKDRIKFLVAQLDDQMACNTTNIETLQTRNKVLNEVIDNLEDILEKEKLQENE